LLAPITSPPVSGFITYGRLAAPSLHNEAESGSLALRLTGSPREASPHGLLRLTLARLPVEWAINRVSSFQLTRSARLILALHTLPFVYAPHGHGRRHEGQCRRHPRTEHLKPDTRHLTPGTCYRFRRLRTRAIQSISTLILSNCAPTVVRAGGSSEKNSL